MKFSLRGNLKPQRANDILFVRRQAIPIAIITAVAWTALFVFLEQYFISLVLIAFILFLLVLHIYGDTRSLPLGVIGAQLLCIAIVLVFCVMFDPYTVRVPRVSHIYLLVIAFAGYVNYRRAPNLFQLFIIWFSLATFAVFSVIPLNFSFALPIADEIRHYTAWANVITALFVFALITVLLQLEVSHEGRMMRDLMAGIVHGDLELFYQPQVNGSGNVVGVEGLLRWRHPEVGFISPSVFIPIAEKAQLMDVVGSWVLDRAAQTLSHWKEKAWTANFKLAINVSAHQFLHDDFVELVLRTCATHSISPNTLKLELTESVFVADRETISEKMLLLRASGIEIALDDFGTGYSSLSYLQGMPFQQLKIDRSFVESIAAQPRAALLARNMVRLALDLDMEVVAEGIETNEQFELMSGFGCRLFQGFYFAPALPLEELQAFAKARFE